jgi:hypothetical protein
MNIEVSPIKTANDNIRNEDMMDWIVKDDNDTKYSLEMLLKSNRIE